MNTIFFSFTQKTQLFYLIEKKIQNWKDQPSLLANANIPPQCIIIAGEIFLNGSRAS